MFRVYPITPKGTFFRTLSCCDHVATLRHKGSKTPSVCRISKLGDGDYDKVSGGGGVLRRFPKSKELPR